MKIIFLKTFPKRKGTISLPAHGQKVSLNTLFDFIRNMDLLWKNDFWEFVISEWHFRLIDEHKIPISISKAENHKNSLFINGEKHVIINFRPLC